MTNEAFVAILLFLGVVIAGFLWLVNAQNGRTTGKLADSIPLPVLEFVLTVLSGFGKPAVEKTPTTIDDEVLQMAIELFEAIKQAKLAQPPTPTEPLPQPTVEELTGAQG